VPEPVSDAEFAAAMARFAPFEPRPLLAVAVSGGADSLALALLAQRWAGRRRGRVVALTVDHGLRAASGGEARRVARWMRHHGLQHRILRWTGPKPAAGIQAAARAARYGLLSAWCRKEGALHLLLGHTLNDQAETVLLRLAGGSGPFGLAAMAAQQETADMRLLRPLLAIARPRLEAWLRARGQDWIDDPSNTDERFERGRLRRLLTMEEAALQGRLAAAAGELGRFRAAQERAVAAALARAVALRPDGVACIAAAAFKTLPAEIGRRALAALLAAVGGLDFLPRTDAVRRLFADIAADRLGTGRTLARCRIVPARHGTKTGGTKTGGALLVFREMRGLARSPLEGGPVRWDGRFVVAAGPRPRAGLEIGPLGTAGWAQAVADAPELRRQSLPYPARLAQPALWDRRGLLAAPALRYHRGRKTALFTKFRPRRSLAPAIFAAVETA
jgi:tRNA(Ile)-lysidine synthase